QDDADDPQRAAEVRFVRFFHNTPMAIATVDRHGRITLSNARLERLFHTVLKAEGAKTAERSICSLVAERDRPAVEAAIRSAAEGQGEIAPVDAALGDDKDERFVRLFVTAIQDQKDRDHEIAIVYALDTTEQRALEKEDIQRKRMETIGRLAGIVAHDFNNLLGAMMMATDFLLNAHRPTDPS